VDHDVINISNILKFNVDVFSYFQYPSGIDNDRAKWIVSFIKEDAPTSGQLFISADNPNKFYNFIFTKELNHSRNELIKIKASSEKKSGKIKSESQESRKELRVDSFSQLLSKRHVWYSLWRKRAGIQIEGYKHFTNYFEFQINLTLFLFYVDSIGTILKIYHAPNLNDGKDLNSILLNKAFDLAFELGDIQIKTSDDKKNGFSEMEFPTELSNNRCIKSKSLVWKWIMNLIIRLDNGLLKKIFLLGNHPYHNPCAKKSFNDIFFHSITNLNQRLKTCPFI
jgi:hypothetical protein